LPGFAKSGGSRKVYGWSAPFAFGSLIVILGSAGVSVR
jgi:hypothetical protein